MYTPILSEQTLFSSERRLFSSPPHDAGVLLNTLPPLSVYAHVPWCTRKCPYCDFNSYATVDIPERTYLNALRNDLEQALPAVENRQVMSVFIGGGTPSLLSSAGLEELLCLLHECLPIRPGAEITMEVNPGAAEAARMRCYAQSGITRFSLGIQSFDDAMLKKLGRLHSAAQAREAIHIAQKSVQRVNLDLMFALPEQDVSGCLNDVLQAIAFGTEHLSIYHLTVEPNTMFAKYPPTLPSQDASADMQEAIEEKLAVAGLRRYEVSAYAKLDAHCRHNMNYWEFGDYLGIGPGAHSKLSFCGGIMREARTPSPSTWMQRAAALDGSHISERRQISLNELPFEFMLNALRLKQGIAASMFMQRTGLPLTTIMPVLEKAVRRGLLDEDLRLLRATELGWRFLNDLQEMFLL